MDKLSPLLFDAIAMYKANETTKRGFTKDSIKSILLTVFGIAPPKALFGTIKTGDEIEVKFKVLLYMGNPGLIYLLKNNLSNIVL